MQEAETRMFDDYLFMYLLVYMPPPIPPIEYFLISTTQQITSANTPLLIILQACE